MEIVVTSGEMRECDRYAIETFNIPGALLMENAGRSVVEAMERRFGPITGKRILIVCGKGNNGGDGFVIARHLLNHNAEVTVLLAAAPNNIKGDALLQYDILRSYVKRLKNSPLRIVRTPAAARIPSDHDYELIVDALFGTGFSGNVRRAEKIIIRKMNACPCPKVSVDVPSGLDATTGSVGNVAVSAGLTVTMAVKKSGLLVGEAKSHVGVLEVGDIGMPQAIVNAAVKSRTWLIEPPDIKAVLPKRPPTAHKYTFGRIFILAGSTGLTGAAAMAASSAMRAGAGAVVLGVPETVYPVLARKLTEVMVQPLPSTREGSISYTAIEQIAQHIERADYIVIGPGLSRNAETQRLIRDVVQSASKPLLIDADGLNALSGHSDVLRKSKSPGIILTPHTGELSRLIGRSSKEIENNRIDIARTTAKDLGVTLVLKGAPTLTATPDGEVYINSTGNAGMATAGAGDILAGAIVGLWSQGMKPTAAAYAGVYLHGSAGDFAREEFGEKALLATDIETYLPMALKKSEERR